MQKFFVLTFLYLSISFASFGLTPILGPSVVCTGGTAELRDTTVGGTWSSSNTAIAVIASKGYWNVIIAGVSPGTATITYTLGGTSVTSMITVGGTMPPAITGASMFCAGTSSTLSDALTGGTWSSESPYTATVGSSSGVVTGVSGGVVAIYYSLGGGCYVWTEDTINIPPVTYISGPSKVCLGSTIILKDSMGFTGGTWSSTNTAVATIGTSTGVVTGISLGTTTISYSVSNACGMVTMAATISVINTTTPPTAISGVSSLYIGADEILSDGRGGGTWSSSNTAVATVDSSTGDVTGISVGSATITYMVTGCGGSAYATFPISIIPFSGISGHVMLSLAGIGDGDTVKVWLIAYDPGTFMLTAVDSVIIPVPGYGTSFYYQFPGKPTDSFRIKAAIIDTMFVTYKPTYHTSSYYWDYSTVLYHVAGTGDINQDINMIHGFSGPGPGFIGGSVLLGANKGTSGSIPSVGLNIFCVDASTGNVVQETVTDASGNYSFNALPLGTYNIFPEELNYFTTEFPGISLTSSTLSVTNVQFIQHTISHTITPVLTGVHGLQKKQAFVITYPNPTSGKLTMQWQEPTAEQATVTISDVTGRQITSTSVAMSEGTGATQIDLSALSNGLYMISIKSAAINYINKIEIQK